MKSRFPNSKIDKNLRLFFFFFFGRKGLWWVWLIEKLSEMVSIDVLEGAALFLVHLKTLFFDQLSFPRHMYGDFDILGSEHLGGSFQASELDQLLRDR